MTPSAGDPNLPGPLRTGGLMWVAVVPLRGCIYCTFYESNVVDRHSKNTKVNTKITLIKFLLVKIGTSVRN